ncbi:MAG: T9SS type A sorting domain-containing protein, partial [Candidatus Marinimicrobia bacterium]|nr:T9SS type A sorting domain-containing protein [Candidatus Neomarinimicrobiota bacterium]
DCLGIPNGTAYENLLTGECELILSTDDIIPNQFTINKIYPDPFNPVVTISYGIPTSQYTEGHIYNLSGKLVHTLISQYQSAGNYSIKWNATGKPSGIYIFILKIDSEVKSQKLVLLK